MPCSRLFSASSATVSSTNLTNLKLKKVKVSGSPHSESNCTLSTTPPYMCALARSRHDELN
eukprot:3573827-Rhodomonas_salina.1